MSRYRRVAKAVEPGFRDGVCLSWELPFHTNQWACDSNSQAVIQFYIAKWGEQSSRPELLVFLFVTKGRADISRDPAYLMYEAVRLPLVPSLMDCWFLIYNISKHTSGFSEENTPNPIEFDATVKGELNCHRHSRLGYPSIIQRPVDLLTAGSIIACILW